jgi:hypothetical protein
MNIVAYLPVDNDDNDHEDVVRLLFWTTDTNGLIVHSWISEFHIVELHRQEKILIRSPELSGISTGQPCFIMNTYVHIAYIEG